MAKNKFNPNLSLPVRKLNQLRQALFALDDIQNCIHYVCMKEQTSQPPMMESAMHLALAQAGEALEALEKHHGCY